jgi:restriction endonuclease S subunit
MKQKQIEKLKNIPKLRFPEFRDAGEWKPFPIGEKVDLLSGYPFDGVDISEDSSGIRLLRGINITEGVIRHSQDIDRYYLGNTEKLEKYRLQDNDLVIGMDGSKVGKNSALITSLDSGALLVQRVARLRTDFLASIQFIFQQINSSKFHAYVDRINTSSGIPHISTKQINDFQICFPATDEQQKIADCLSSIDDRITAETQKLATLKAHKKGLMQQLFPAEGETLPKLRFPEFQDSGEWEEKRLEDIAPLQRGFDLPSDQIKLGNIPIVYSNGIQNFHNIGMAEAPGIVTGRSGTIGKIHFIEEGNYWPHNTSLWVTSFKGNFPKFIYYLYKSIGTVRFASGSGVPTLNRNYVHAFNTSLPASLEEQQKIADFLTSIDEAIAAQTQKIATLKTHKKGLMQQLFPNTK